MWPFMSGFFALSMMFIQLVTCISTLFLFMVIYHSIVWIYYILFIHSLVDGHLGGCHCWLLWTILLWIFIYKFLWPYIFIFLGYVHWIGIAGSYVNSVLTFWGTTSFLYCVCIILHSYQQQMKVPFSCQNLFFSLF